MTECELGEECSCPKTCVQCYPSLVKTLNGHPVTPLTLAVRDIVNEFKRASRKYPDFNSFHEGYAVLEEELDELWDEVKKKTSEPPTDQAYDPTAYQDPVKLRAEAIQTAAMALRFVVDLCAD
jgi:hypothetical protein